MLQISGRRVTHFCVLLLLPMLVVFSPPLARAAGVLPNTFAGWSVSGTPQTTTDPAQAGNPNPGALKEYGFKSSEIATYTRDDGRKLTLHAMQFADATGAYGAFTLDRTAHMQPEQIGTKAASANDRVLFFRSNMLVEAKFDHTTAMSAAELRELAGRLPAVTGTADSLPNLPNYLPARDAVEGTAKYILGPQALSAAQTAIRPDEIDFSREPEILTQDYSLKEGPVTLALIEYPTPQIAIQQLKSLESNASGKATDFIVRRTGPIIVAATGAVNNSDAQDFINSVHYEVNVTWNEATSISKRDNIGNLMIAAFTLIGIILLISLIFGVFFGGIRIVMKRLFPDRVFDRPEDVEIIQLHLR